MFTLGPDVILNTKINKNIGSHNGFVTQSMHYNQINHYDKTKKSILGQSYKHCQPELKKTTSWTTAGQDKNITHLWKLYEDAVIESEARTQFLLMF